MLKLEKSVSHFARIMVQPNIIDPVKHNAWQAISEQDWEDVWLIPAESIYTATRNNVSELVRSFLLHTRTLLK
jgi:hypothetical protein